MSTSGGAMYALNGPFFCKRQKLLKSWGCQITVPPSMVQDRSVIRHPVKSDNGDVKISPSFVVITPFCKNVEVLLSHVGGE